MKKQHFVPRKPLIYTAIVAFILTVISLFYVLNDTEEKVVDAADIKSVVKEIKSPNKSFDMFLETYQNTSITYTLQYPQLHSATFDDTIKSYITTQKKKFLKNNDQGSLTIEVESSPYLQQYFSFTFKTIVETDSGRVEEFKSYVYNYKAEKFVSIKALFNSNYNHLYTYRTHIKQQLITNAATQSIVYPSTHLDVSLSDDWSLYANFAIENNALVVYFKPETVAPKKYGYIAVTVPMNDLHALLANRFKQNKVDKKTMITPLQDPTKRIALTFDDGPHPNVTPAILKLLNKYDAKATFFLMGQNAEKYPNVVKMIHENGHEIGNHTWNHPNLTKLSLNSSLAQYNRTDDIIEQIIGERPTVMRPPYGATTEALKKKIPVPSVNWSIDTLDWKYRQASKTVARTKATLHNNGIILMHDIYIPTEEALRILLPYLKEQGYSFYTISELLPYITYTY